MMTFFSEGPAIATFVPQSHTKSGSTNLPDGVVHVFRDVERQISAETNEGTSVPDGDCSRVMLENADSDGYMIGVLAVPSWMTPSDFLAFVAPAQDGMAHLRMIRYVSLLLGDANFDDISLFFLIEIQLPIAR
jgi:BRCA1-associated protein